MVRLMRNTVVFWVSIALFSGLLPHPAGASSPAAMKAVKAAQKSPDTVPKDPLEGLSDAEIDALLGRLIEAKIRQTVDQEARLPVRTRPKVQPRSAASSSRCSSRRKTICLTCTPGSMPS